MLSVLEAGLKEYVAKPDPSYHWELIDNHEIDESVQGYSLELTSQTWHGIVWKHALRVIVPMKMRDQKSNGILIIGGSRRLEKERIEKDLKRGKKVAKSVGAPVALLYDVPLQPLFGGLKEDKLLAETFTRYKDTNDETWPIIFPMVKSAVRAMDALQDFLSKVRGIKVKNFLVTGASKRGWTTWLTPVVDHRVFGIAPLVYDNLNLTRQMEYQLECWGKYSRSISAYTEKNLPQKLLKKEDPVSSLATMIDPYTFIREIKVPKLLVNGTNDPFWVIDAVNNYKDQLVGKTYLHYSPNAGHGLDKRRDEIISSIVTFFKSLDGRILMPEIEYDVLKMEQSYSLQYHSNIEPWEVSLITARSPVRDFRKSEWKELPLLEKRGRFSKTVSQIKGEYLAFYCQGVYYLDGEELVLSTPIQVLKPALVIKNDSDEETSKSGEKKEPVAR